MEVLVESGATFSRWIAVETANPITITSGINPNYMTDDQIRTILQKIKERYGLSPSVIYYYGAGLHSGNERERLRFIIEQIFQCSVFIFHDILGTARAIFGKSPGIACILGTGSNSAYYTGTHLIEEMPPGGYLLGDEGAATHMARILLRNFLYGKVPPHIYTLLADNHGLSYDTIIREVYGPNAFSFLSMVASIIIDLRNDDYILRHVVIPSLEEFFIERIIPLWEKYRTPLGFSGSVAHFFEHVLKAISGSIPVVRVLKEITKELCQYHIKYGASQAH